MKKFKLFDKIHKRVKEIAAEGREDRKTGGEVAMTKANAKYRRAEAYATKKLAKSEYRRAQADKIRAKQGYKKTAARAAAIGSIASAFSNAAQSKYSNQALAEKYKAESSGLVPWQQLINNSSKPAEGTGESNPGDSSGSGSSTTLAPVD